MDGSEVELDEHQLAGVVARLAVRVAEQPAAVGRARVRYRLSLEGPSSLQVDAPRLEDAFAAWQVTSESSSRSVEAQAKVEWTLHLEQLKPGVVPLPGLRLRVREGPRSDWQELSWPDPLLTPRSAAPILELPSDPPSSGIVSWHAACVLLIVGLMIVLLLRRARRRPPTPPLSPAQRAQNQLARCTDLTAITEVVRDFLTEQTGIAAHGMTTAELLDVLEQRGEPTENLSRFRRLLELGDLVKFAGLQASSEEIAQSRELAIRMIGTIATCPGGETDRSGEEG